MFDLCKKEVYIVKECAGVGYENGVVTHSCRQKKKKGVLVSARGVQSNNSSCKLYPLKLPT